MKISGVAWSDCGLYAGLGACMEFERHLSDCGASWISRRGRSGIGVRVVAGSVSSGGDATIREGGTCTSVLGPGLAAVSEGSVCGERGKEISARSGVVGPSSLAP